MLSSILSAATSLAVTVVLVPLLIAYARRTNHYSILDFRRRSRERVPLVGGIAMFTALIFVNAFSRGPHFILLGACALVIFTLGFIDDRFELSARPKILTQLLSTLIFLAGSGPDALLLHRLGLPPIISIFLSAFWMVGAINAVNMIDGYDGLAGSVLLIVSLGLALVTQNASASLLASQVVGVCLGFLIFNRPRARVYLGDAGSTTFGFILAAMAVTLDSSATQGAWCIPLFLFAHPCADALLAIFRRWRLGVPLMRGDHDHIHHKMEKVGLTSWQGLAIMISVNLICLVSACLIAHTSGWVSVGVGALGAASSVLVLWTVFFVEERLTDQARSYGHSVLAKCLSALTTCEIRDQEYVILVFDLRPYYSELHRFGILTIENFLLKLTMELRRVSPECVLSSAGDYSLIIRHPVGTPPKFLIEVCGAVISEYRLTKTADEVPLGLSIMPEFIDRPKEIDHAS